jgi:hypothetical protein
VSLDPVATLSKITKSGDVQIIFSQNMNVPFVEVMKTTLVKKDGQWVPALELIIAPGYYSMPGNLTFTYNITSYSPRMMTLKINLDNPLLVSSYDDPDALIVKFNAKFFFFSDYGRLIK